MVSGASVYQYQTSEHIRTGSLQMHWMRSLLPACTDERSAGVHGYIPANKDFRDRDTSIKNTDDFLARHAEPVLLDGCGFIVYMLKVQGDDDACIFLKDNRCSIQEVKPSACRIYPLVASPTANGRFEYMVCLEQPHHFKGAVVSVKRWINRVFFAKEKEALYMDYQSVPKIAGLLCRIPEHNRNRAIALFL